MWGVGRSQTIKEEAHRSVAETCERWVGARSRIATVKPAETQSQNRYQKRLLKSEVVACTVWKGYCEKEISAFTNMIVRNETGEASKGPTWRDAIDHGIEVAEQRESTVSRPEGTEEHAAEEPPERGN